MEKVEFLILRNLLHNEKYIRKVIPFIKSEYFEDQNQKIVFEIENSQINQQYPKNWNDKPNSNDKISINENDELQL